MAVAGLVLLTSAGLFADWYMAYPTEVSSHYVGSHTCMDCHQQQHHDWLGSHHELAMQRATEDTVLADFDDAQLEHFGITSRMFRQDGKFMVHTEGPDGEMADFEVKYVFGVEPLQQYMVEFDRPDDMPENEIPRVQVLRLSWDTEKERWFYLSPPDVDERLAPDDDLHWTGITQRWNTSCAECHSTNLQKNYDHEQGLYRTTFSEINVSCEACHGPGSLHVELAKSNSLFWDRRHGFGLPNLKSRDPEIEIHACAPCHSRRSEVHPNYRPGENFYDFFSNELLGELTYHPDGQILDEVFEYGSYVQSKMYHRHIRCTDCHDPHTARLRFEGNLVCTSCHEHPAGRYDTPAHHHHPPQSTGASCVECHMPHTTYMEVDPRRDHSLRVPRPDLSVELGTPNACTRCHLDRADLAEEKREGLDKYSDWLRAAREGDEQVRAALAGVDRWAAEAMRGWYGEYDDLERHFAFALVAARRGEQGADEQLAELAGDLRQPAIVRATAVMELGRYRTRTMRQASRDALDDPDPSVRAVAVANFQDVQQPREMLRAVAPLLEDPIRTVRVEAARVLARVPRQYLHGRQRQLLTSAIEEYKQAQLINNDRAAAHMNLGILYENLGDTQQAIEAYRTAIRVEPGTTGPRTNLAALYDRSAEEREQQAQQEALRGATAAAEQALAEARRYREKSRPLLREELEHLERDAKLAPDNAMIRYRYGLLLYRHDRLEEAEAQLKKACRLAPNNDDFVYTLMRLYYEQGRMEEALPWAEQLIGLRPDHTGYMRLYREIRQGAGN